MFYIYLLENELGDFYTGFTNDLRRRLTQHNQGLAKTTRKHSWHCIYYEGCVTEEDARRRERYLKTTAGRRALRARLKIFLAKRRKPKLH